MRFTIERIRTLVLVTGVLLVVALAAFLAIGKWKNPFNRRDIPKRLGIDIEQEANGVTYTQAHAGHTIFKIHASKVVQLKNSHAMLHDVRIELYGVDGSRVDRIVGDEFEYDQKEGTATAAGPVEITLMRPGEKPAIAAEPLLEQEGGKKPRTNPQPTPATTPSPAAGANTKTADSGQINVKTSGLIFNQETGVASTAQKVNFSSAQGSGSSVGATYDSQNGYLELDHAVELTTLATAARRGAPVVMHADHAEFKRDTSVCNLHAVTAKTQTEDVTAADAQLLFRDDGSVAELDATNGFTVATAAGSHLAAPSGTVEFDQDNQPRFAHLQGGVTMDSTSDGRVVHGTTTAMALEFTAGGDLRHAHMEQTVDVHSDDKTQSMVNGQPVPVEETRTWHSTVADVDFRQEGKGPAEPAAIHGVGGVVVTGESRKGSAAPVPSRLAADDVTGEFGPQSTLTSLTGTGHATIEETTTTGAHDTATGDRLEAHFLPSPANPARDTVTASAGNTAASGAAQIQSAAIEGHVVLVQQPATQAGSKAGAETPLRATAGRAEYDGAGEWLHLTVSPRVDHGGLQLSTDKLDIAQGSGDAFAHGNVKATWMNNGMSDGTDGGGTASGNQGDIALGGKGPAHAIAAEAEMHESSGVATFRGHARLWQDANSVAAPVIDLDRQKQILTAKSSDAAEPVRVVMVSASASPGSLASPVKGSSVVRMRGGDLWYSGIERRAQMHGGALGLVTADTGGVESASSEVELFLTPSNNSAAQPGLAQSQPGAAQSQVDRMTATGHVVLTSQGRHGTGEQLVYTSRTGDYVLTGTSSTLPRMTDPVRGTVTGETLIFHSRDDSVSIEGGGRKTTTETTAPR